MKYSLKEYILYISLQLITKAVKFLPVKIILIFGKILGTLAFYIDRRHRNVAYKNLRMALAGELSLSQSRKILKQNFQNFGMNLTETLIIPRFDRRYVDRYIEIEGKENLDAALAKQKGAIMLSIHMGNWEVYFAAVGILKLPVYILFEEQIKNPLLDKFLNQMRQSKGVKTLKVGSQMREAIHFLKENMIIGLVADHGIKEGIPVEFFGRKTNTPTGAIRLALKFDKPILSTYVKRIKDNRHKIVIMPAYNLRKSNNFNEDIVYNLTQINKIFENFIRENPAEYYWAYKRFKYNQDREVLILTDGKAGHMRQSQACLKLIKEIGKEKNLEIRVKQVKVDFKNKLSKISQMLGVGLAKKSTCRGCLWCLKAFLKRENFLDLQSYFADMVVSCGSSLAGVNFVVSSENQAKSIVIMRPGILSTNRFNLVIMNRHDNPPKRKNIVVTEGSLSLIDKNYLGERTGRFMQQLGIKAPLSKLCIGLLIGGDTKVFHLEKRDISEVIRQIKSRVEKNNGDILVTTSRRTSREIEELVKNEFQDYARCKGMIIANERNIPETVEAILALSQIAVVSPESISMISESASSGKYVLTFQTKVNLGKRHTKFLNHLQKNGYIYLEKIQLIGETIEDIYINKPPIRSLQDGLKVRKALEKIL